MLPKRQTVLDGMDHPPPSRRRPAAIRYKPFSISYAASLLVEAARSKLFEPATSQGHATPLSFRSLASHAMWPLWILGCTLTHGRIRRTQIEQREDEDLAFLCASAGARARLFAERYEDAVAGLAWPAGLRTSHRDCDGRAGTGDGPSRSRGEILVDNHGSRGDTQTAVPSTPVAVAS